MVEAPDNFSLKSAVYANPEEKKNWNEITIKVGRCKKWWRRRATFLPKIKKKLLWAGEKWREIYSPTKQVFLQELGKKNRA